MARRQCSPSALAAAYQAGVAAYEKGQFIDDNRFGILPHDSQIVVWGEWRRGYVAASEAALDKAAEANRAEL